MKIGSKSTRLLFVAATAVHFAAMASGAKVAPPVESLPVQALIYSTMPSTSQHRPEMAMDHDANTYFESTYGMDDGDDFIVILSRPIPMSGIRITSGDANGNDLLTHAIVETSFNTKTYTKVADFDSVGTANATFKRLNVMAIRIRMNHGAGAPRLALREISIESPVKIENVRIGPPRGFVDISQAPDLADWAARAEKDMESFWNDTAAILYTDGFITPNAVNVIYRTGPRVTGVAATGGGVMEVNSAYCRRFPHDTALTVHETAHVVQASGGNAPGWLIEGVADYIRWVKFEPQSFHPKINVEKATYHDAYRTSAAFLGWCSLHYDSELVTKLNQYCRFGGYSNALFEKFCGKSVDALWLEFVADYKADPENILTPPVPAAMVARALPSVSLGTSVPVDLTSLFNIVGIAKDHSNYSPSTSFDGEGYSYPSKFLPSQVTSHDVLFQLGAPGLPDALSPNKNVVSLPAGSYHSLWILASAIEGSNRNDSLLVTYTDGTEQSFAQNFSDWYLPGDFPGETRAVKSDYRVRGDGSLDTRTFYVYSYGYPLDRSKTVQSLTLPDASDLRILAISLAN
jgi:hypothetical protein